MAIEVQTTQNVIIDYEPAGIGNRMLAALIDYAFMLLWVLAWIGIFLLSDVNLFDFLAVLNLNVIILVLIAALLTGPVIFYHLLCEYFNNGQSIGKKIVKIRVVKVDGTPPSFGSYLLRWLFRIVDVDLSSFVVPGLIGLISVISTKKSQRLGDLVAGTTVIDLKIYSKNKELRLTDLDFKDNYVVTYPQVLERLSDRDIQTIISIIDDNSLKDLELITARLAGRIKAMTGYSFNGPDVLFLRKIVSDYNFLSLQ